MQLNKEEEEKAAVSKSHISISIKYSITQKVDRQTVRVLSISISSTNNVRKKRLISLKTNQCVEPIHTGALHSIDKSHDEKDSWLL